MWDKGRWVKVGVRGGKGGYLFAWRGWKGLRGHASWNAARRAGEALNLLMPVILAIVVVFLLLLCAS